MDESHVSIGIDVSKDFLDWAATGTSSSGRVANDPAGHQSLLQTLKALKPAWIILEATGSLELSLIHI